MITPRSLVTIVCVVLLSGCPCPTTATLGVLRGSNPPAKADEPGHLVAVCPREPVTLAWATTEAISATLTDVESVALPTGFRTIDAGDSTRDYILQCKGKSCDPTQTVKVVVASVGSSLSIGTQGRKGPTGSLFWEAVLQQQFYSPQIQVMSIRLSEPATVKGWSVHKADLNGAIHDFPATNVAASPWSSPIPLTGTWQFAPISADEVDPRALPKVEVVVTMTCEQ